MRNPLNLPVEPLSQQRFSKIERSLFARLDAEVPRQAAAPAATRGIPTLAWFAAAAALAALVLVLVQGRLWGGDEATDRTSNITTGATPSHVALPGLSLDVQPDSAVVVGGAPDRAMLIVVDRGGVVCDVAPRSSSAPLVIQAGATRVRVVGTRFSVTRTGESARVAVEHGTVEVSLAGKSWRVSAGQVWSNASLTSAVADPSRPRAEARANVLPSAQVDAALPSKPAARRNAGASADSAQSQFEEAARLERSDPGRALSLYRALESGSGSWAQNALFARGRLEVARGNRAEARRLLEQYLALFPRGGNADDARAVLERLR